MITFSVEGLPVPQGSKSLAHGGGKTWMRDANASRLKPWREKVARAADVGETFDCPVMVVAVFYLPRPKKLRWWAPAGRVGDLDKLCRAILDGCEAGGLLADDARVTHLRAVKRYEDESNPVGVRVLVMEDTPAFRPDKIDAVARRLMEGS